MDNDDFWMDQRIADAEFAVLRTCRECDCPKARCEGYGRGRKCCPDCKHT